jgi:hypothetical protein
MKTLCFKDNDINYIIYATNNNIRVRCVTEDRKFQWWSCNFEIDTIDNHYLFVSLPATLQDYIKTIIQNIIFI